MATPREAFMKAVNSLVSRPEGIKDRLKFALKNVAEVGEEHVPHSDRKRWGEVLGGIAAAAEPKQVNAFVDGLSDADATSIAMTILRIHHVLILTARR